ncbi:hypothetical protein WJX73_009272 [Symbiochloris irregularis]|uniref:Amine oxidase domain-containing protein n=1 Tax=Symbiochloris irregularis TaxID=706552 RepID=A0AAW1PEZ8_9CHLO
MDALLDKQVKAFRASLPEHKEVVIVGAGLAGLSCGLHLHRAGVPFVLLEASDGVGGRVRTDKVDGYLLDRGFQIFLTSYEEAKAVLDYDALDLEPFYAGALVRWQGGFHRVADPLRHPLDGVLSLTNPIGSPPDKVKIGVFRTAQLLSSPERLLAAEETTTMQRLQAEGFSPAIIQRFFQPFLGGIFFDADLNVTSRLFAYVMRCLATGANCLPAQGIGAVSEQLASRLPQTSIHTGQAVQEVRPAADGRPASVTLKGGQSIAADAVVVATEGPTAAKLLSSSAQASPSKPEPGVGTACLYYRARQPPSQEPILYLNGDGKGLINNAQFLSNVAPSYAPAGQSLLSVSTLGTHDELSDQDLSNKIKGELKEWFGAEAEGYQLMRIYRIPFAQPNQAPPTNFEREVVLGNGLFVCGDHRASATFNGALTSGRRAAEAVQASLSAGTMRSMAMA